MTIWKNQRCCVFVELQNCISIYNNGGEFATAQLSYIKYAKNWNKLFAKAFYRKYLIPSRSETTTNVDFIINMHTPAASYL